MTGLIFGIIVPILLTGGNDIQQYVDNYAGVHVGSTGCNEGKYIFAHNYKRLGKRIYKLKTGQIVTFSGCTYKVSKVRNVLAKSDWRKWIDWTATYMQTCINSKYNRVVTLSPIE